MELAKSTNKSRNWLKDVLWVAVGIFIIAIAVVFFQNLENKPQQTEVRKEVKIK